jgi:hypothetical protein
MSKKGANVPGQKIGHTVFSPLVQNLLYSVQNLALFFQVHCLVSLVPLLKLVARLLFESIRSPSFTNFIRPIRKK